MRGCLVASPVQHDVQLRGCAPEPLMSYLKSLGILRLVTEQKDPSARGWWRNEEFWLRSTLDQAELVRFFLEEYAPTPIVAPWAGGSGFFEGDNKIAVDALNGSSGSRLEPYRRVIAKVRQIIQSCGLSTKPTAEDKVRLIRQFRCELPEEALAWMDAAAVLLKDDQKFAPLLGTGANDGRLNFAQNFVQRLVALQIHVQSRAGDESRDWLRNSLLGERAKLGDSKVGQFCPGRAGGPNATHGMEGDSSDNPWDFILMLEGAVMIGGASSRRFSASGSGRATFPFTVASAAAGLTTPATKDLGDSRGEIWLPLWNRPLMQSELGYLFGEGRSQLSDRAARDGIDFARAVADLGVDRGIDSFTRVGFLKRSGLAYLAAPLGRFAVEARREVDLLGAIDDWLRGFRRACNGAGAPARFKVVLERIDSAVFDVCRHGGVPAVQRLLLELGAAERSLGTAPRFCEEGRIKPINGLTAAWITAADDESPEFRLALALSSLNAAGSGVGPLRSNLEAVDWSAKRSREWGRDRLAVVWSSRSLSSNLGAVLERRLMDSERQGDERLPLGSAVTAPISVVSAFLAEELDEARVEHLIWGLMLVHSTDAPTLPPVTSGASILPRAYALLKLAFLSGPLVAYINERGEKSWRIARGGELGIRIRPEPRVIALLRTGRLGEACQITAQRLRVSGLDPMPGQLPSGKMRDDAWAAGPPDPKQGARLAASLLIPISSSAVNRLVQLVCRGQSVTAETIALVHSERNSQ